MIMYVKHLAQGKHSAMLALDNIIWNKNLTLTPCKAWFVLESLCHYDIGRFPLNLKISFSRLEN